MQNPKPTRSVARRWLAHLFREWTIESWRPIAPASAKPEPSQWSDTQFTLAWIGHSTVLINFFGVTILTDPVLFPRIGDRKSTRLNSSHLGISYAVFCLK